MIQAVDSADPALLALNNAHALELSLLTAGRFAALVERAFLAVRIGAAEAFLLAFDQSAEYASVNFLWFFGRATSDSSIWTGWWSRMAREGGGLRGNCTRPWRRPR